MNRFPFARRQPVPKAISPASTPPRTWRWRLLDGFLHLCGWLLLLLSMLSFLMMLPPPIGLS